MSDISIIKELGLSEQEASAYLALLKLGGGLASNVAKEMGVKRTTIYAILKSLAHKGYITVYFKKNKRYYYPQKPHKLSNLFEKKLEAFNMLIPSLESMEKKQAQAIGLRFIETKEELKQFYNGVLEDYKNKVYKEHRAIGNDIHWESIDPEFFKWYRRQRSRLGIKVRLLLSYSSKKSFDFKPIPHRTMKLLPPNYDFKTNIDIFDNKILVIGPDLSSLAVVIEIPAMTDVFKSIFEILWEKF